MRLLLDTHALLWWLSDDDQLGARARRFIADPADDVLVSAASLWEIVVKARISKLKANIGEIMDAIHRDGLTLLGISAAHLSALAGLAMHHRDPFDHMLVAQAITEEAGFVTEDQRIGDYPVQLVSCRS